MKKEISFYAEKYNDDRKIISIYFGGGTPSFMEPEYISEIIEHVKQNFVLAENPEITLETNPGTVDKQKLENFNRAGINRISIGIQSFNEDELKFLTRIHDAQTAIKTVCDATKAGFANINIDLIFNLPGQTKQKWLNNLDEALRLPITHLSAYSLILEHGTILNKMVLDGKVKMQSDDYDAELYEITIDHLTQKGFEQYEVSNFALQGYECMHNNAYWRYKDYLSFGTSAHSFVNGKRWWNFSSVKFYNDAVSKNGNGIAGEEILTKEEMLDEYVMLALRSSGLDMNELEKLFGRSWLIKNQNYISRLIEQKFLTLTSTLLKFTSKGYAVCDEILAKLK